MGTVPFDEPDSAHFEAATAANPEQAADLIPEAQWKRFHWATPLFSLWKVWAALVAFALSILVQALDAGVSEILETLTGISRTTVLIIIAVLVGLSLLVVLVAWVFWRKQRYVLAPSGIHYRSGIISGTHRHVRWDRIQSVEIKQGIIPRIVGLGAIVIDSASTSGDDLSLGLLKMNEIQRLRGEILRIATAARTGQEFQVEDRDLPNLYDPDDAYQGEKPFYRLPTKVLLGSMLRSGTVLGIIGGIAIILIPVFLFDESFSIGIIVALGGAVAVGWGQFNLNHGLQLFLTADGIRVRRGLTTTTTQTIPPRRIHAVKISQFLLWRGKDWWQVEVLVAGSISKDADNASTMLMRSVIMPVGTRAEALDLLWTIVPDIGVDNLQEFFDDALVGKGPSAFFVAPPRKSRWLDPLRRKRNGIALTRTVAVLRDGWASRSMTVAFHGHWQGLKATQGPIQRKLGLATCRLSLVSGTIHWEGKNFGLTQVHGLLEEERNIGLEARARNDRESIDQWAERVGVS